MIYCIVGAWQEMRPELLVVRKTGRSWNGWPAVGPNLNKWSNELRSFWAVWLANGLTRLPARVALGPIPSSSGGSGLCNRVGRIAGRAAPWSQAGLWRGLSQPGSGAFGTAPPPGQACWDGPAVAAALNGSVHAVWRVLRQEGICLQRQRSWCVSTDKEFAAKAADVVGLYLNPPEKALVISVDEKPSIQALERKTGYVETDNGKLFAGLRAPISAMGRSTSLRRWKWRPGKSKPRSPN